jgi:hypothetical protein
MPGAREIRRLDFRTSCGPSNRKATPTRSGHSNGERNASRTQDKRPDRHHHGHRDAHLRAGLHRAARQVSIDADRTRQDRTTSITGVSSRSKSFVPVSVRCFISAVSLGTATDPAPAFLLPMAQLMLLSGRACSDRSKTRRLTSAGKTASPEAFEISRRRATAHTRPAQAHLVQDSCLRPAAMSGH